MIGRTTGCQGLNTLESQLPQIQPTDKDLHHANGIIFPNVVIKTLGQQTDLSARHDFNEPFHADILSTTKTQLYRQSRRFYTASVGSVSSPDRQAALQRDFRLNYR